MPLSSKAAHECPQIVCAETSKLTKAPYYFDLGATQLASKLGERYREPVFDRSNLAIGIISACFKLVVLHRGTDGARIGHRDEGRQDGLWSTGPITGGFAFSLCSFLPSWEISRRGRHSGFKEKSGAAGVD